MHPYEARYRKVLSGFAPGLDADLSLVLTLETEQAGRVVRYLLGLACEAQNIANINLGRAALKALPRPWVIERIRECEPELLSKDPEWEGRRLYELYCDIDPDRAAEIKRLLSL